MNFVVWQDLCPMHPTYIHVHTCIWDKIASGLNRYNFPTDNTTDFLFSTYHTTPFHYEVLKIGIDSVIRWQVIAIQTDAFL